MIEALQDRKFAKESKQGLPCRSGATVQTLMRHLPQANYGYLDFNGDVLC